MNEMQRGQTLGPYEVLSKLGQGGMGEVYRARDTRLDRFVAIKILPGRLAADPQLRERFEREARAIAALNHPNICTIHDVGEAGGVPFIAMELLEGETLDERIRRGPLGAAEAVDVAIQLGSGLAAAHGKGIIHRDLKPSNLFLTAGGAVKIVDFGIARVAGPAAETMAETSAPGAALTTAGTTLGTIAYMSPEQARGEPVDARSDVFSFGAVVFEMLTGIAAFRGSTPAVVFDALLHTVPPRVGALAPSISPALEAVVTRALEKGRADRYQTVEDVVSALKAARDGSSAGTTTRPPKASVSLGSRSRHSRWVLAGVAVAAIVAAIFFKGRFSAGPPAEAPGPAIRAVAVLPLVNVSGGSDAEIFTDGITDELIGALAKLRAWRVISRTSVMPYKNVRKPLPEIARELGVDALVEGTVQQAGDRVRITATLVRAAGQEQNLWSGTYDREVRDILDLQADVVRAISAEIKLTVTPQEQQRLAARHPVDPGVFQLYLKGRAAANLGTEDGLIKAIAYFEQALQKDPNYASAHAAMALAYAALNPAYRAPKDVMPKSRDHAVRAIEIDDSLSEAHTALAGVMFRYDWDWDNAKPEIERAIDLNPNSADAHELYGNYLTAVANTNRAIEELTLAHQLNPSALSTYASLLASLVTLREYDRAIAESRRAIELHPDFAFAYAWLGMAYAMQGQFAEAIPYLERARMMDDNVTTTHFLAMVQAASGNRQAAEKLVANLEVAANTRYTCAYEVASVHLRLGNKEKAMQWLRRGVDEQCDCMVWLETEPWMDPLRVDSRYADLVKRVGFPSK